MAKPNPLTPEAREDLIKLFIELLNSEEYSMTIEAEMKEIDPDRFVPTGFITMTVRGKRLA